MFPNPYPRASALRCETTRDSANPHWWPYSQNIIFDDHTYYALDDTPTIRDCTTRTVLLKDLIIPEDGEISKPYIKALQNDILSRRQLKPMHGYLTLQECPDKDIQEGPVGEGYQYKISDGFPLYYALEGLLHKKKILEIGPIQAMTTSLQAPEDFLSGSCQGNRQDTVRFEAISDPSGDTGMDYGYAGDLRRWINNEFLDFSGFGHIFAITSPDPSSTNVIVQQGRPLVHALKMSKFSDDIPVGDIPVDVTVTTLNM